MRKSFREILQEISDNSRVVYINPDTSQYVTTSIHADNEGHVERQWWDSWKDETFIKFVKKALGRLNGLYKEKLSDPNYPVGFYFGEPLAVSSKDGKKGLIISLRDTGGNKYTSFNIVTVLNSETNADPNKPLYFKEKGKHLIVLTEKEEVEYFLIKLDE